MFKRPSYIFKVMEQKSPHHLRTYYIYIEAISTPHSVCGPFFLTNKNPSLAYTRQFLPRSENRREYNRRVTEIVEAMVKLHGNKKGGTSPTDDA